MHPDLQEDLEAYGPPHPPQAKGRQGSAIVLVDGALTMAITLPCPYPDSVDAEFWALLCLLRSLVASEPGDILIFCDNLQVVSTLKGIRKGKPSSSPRKRRQELGRLCSGISSAATQCRPTTK